MILELTETNKIAQRFIQEYPKLGTINIGLTDIKNQFVNDTLLMFNNSDNGINGLNFPILITMSKRFDEVAKILNEHFGIKLMQTGGYANAIKQDLPFAYTLYQNIIS